MPSVFGYASLVGAREAATAPAATLGGYAREWNVAMDNTQTIPGYRYFVDPDGSRPAIFVTFLNVVPAAGSSVNGVLLDAASDALERFDRRERNYRRVEVTDAIDPPPAAPVWVYVGLDEARERYERGVRERRCAVSRAYHAAVVDGFRRAGADAHRRFEASTRPPRCPLRDLEAVAVPFAGPATSV
jgi:hypothetical protein